MPHDNIPYLHAVFPRTRMCRKHRTLWIRRLVAETHLQISDIEIYRRQATIWPRLTIKTQKTNAHHKPQDNEISERLSFPVFEEAKTQIIW